MSDESLIGPSFDEIRMDPKYIHGELEGQQIAWLYVNGNTIILDTKLVPQWVQPVWVGAPGLWDSIGIETTRAGRMMVFAAPVLPGEMPPYRTAVIWRWITPPMVMWGTKEQEQHLRGFQSQPELHPIQKWVHGAIIKNVKVEPLPNANSGQDVTFELDQGMTMYLRAMRRRQSRDPFTGEWAQITLSLKKPTILTSVGGIIR